MAFDDLAKHMASRDGKKALQQPAGDGAAIVADAIRADRRMRRTRDLILGPLLLLGGGVVVVLYVLMLRDAGDPNPSRLRPPSDGIDDSAVHLPIYLLVAGGAMAIAGLLQTIRGLRGRHPGDPKLAPAVAVERRDG